MERHQAALTESWNGTKWTIRSTPPTGDSFTDLTNVSCPTTSDCVAVGETGTTEKTVPVIERWNGTAWAIQKSPVIPAADAPGLNSVSCATASSCTAIGSYLTSSGAEPLAEHWNGAKWSRQTIPGATNYPLYAVSCPSATSCTAAGGYSTGPNSGGLPLAAHWNGTAWSLQYPPNPANSHGGELNGISCPSTTKCVASGFYHAPGSGHAGFTDTTLIEVN